MSLGVVVNDFVVRLMRGGYYVRDRDRPDRTVPIVPRRAQQRLSFAALQQLNAGKPVRLLVPKARKQGVSTWSSLLAHAIACHLPSARCMTAAHSKDSVRDIFDIPLLANRHADTPGKQSRTIIEWPDTDSRYECRTALGAHVGSGGTLNMLHVSEVAKMQREAGADSRALASLISAVPQLSPETVIIQEATGQGPTGEFYERCLQARDGDGTYALVFVPWFEDPAYSLATVPEGFKPDDYEKDIQAEFSLSLNQLAWRRQMLKDEYAGRELEFKWDYPSRLDEAFLSPLGRVLPTFSKERHVRPLSALPFKDRPSVLAVGVDWGDRSPFAAVFCRIFAAQQPGLTIDPSAVNLIRECLGWMRDPQTGKPEDQNDHAIDGLRYVIQTLAVDSHLHVESEIYVPNSAARGHTPLTLGDEIRQRLRGRQCMAVVCDRARPDNINMLRALDLPARPYTVMSGSGQRGHIEQGVGRMLALLDGTRPFFDAVESVLERAQRKMLQSMRDDGREAYVPLTDEEERALEEREAERGLAKYGDV